MQFSFSFTASSTWHSFLNAISEHYYVLVAIISSHCFFPLLLCLQAIPPQSASSYSCMLPPSPSAPRSFDTSPYSSSHLQTPPSASSNTGKTHLTDKSSFTSLPWQTVSLSPSRSHIAGCFGARSSPGRRAAEHESEPGSVLGQITVRHRQSLQTGNTKRKEKKRHVLKINKKC